MECLQSWVKNCIACFVNKTGNYTFVEFDDEDELTLKKFNILQSIKSTKLLKEEDGDDCDNHHRIHTLQVTKFKII